MLKIYAFMNGENYRFNQWPLIKIRRKIWKLYHNYQYAFKLLSLNFYCSSVFTAVSIELFSASYYTHIYIILKIVYPPKQF